MLCRTQTVAFLGIVAHKIDVQVQIGGGLPAFTIVGLPDKSVVESRERIRAAFVSMGLSLPPKRITVNLAPADLPKEGSHFDLPIALGLMGAMEILPLAMLEEHMALGELGLDGSLSPIHGALPASLKAAAEGKILICPEPCGAEAAWGRADGGILAPGTLLQIVNHFKGEQMLTAPQPAKIERGVWHRPASLAFVKGQESAKRALIIAAAGGHNMLMIGHPGVGKSMLAQSLPALVPPLTPEEVLESYQIASLAGQIADGRLSDRPPYRAPHHSASMAAMVGGGPKAQPGEVALAHLGVLFLDEFAEFPRPVLDALRQPMETGEITVARARAHLTYPARFQLVAAMNPCRCGYAGDPSKACAKVPRCIRDYMARISGPLLDRIDIFIELSSVPAHRMAEAVGGEERAREEEGAIRQRIARARLIQARRMEALSEEREREQEQANGKGTPRRLNAHIPDSMLEKAIPLESAALAALQEAAEAMNLSARGYARVLRVARTIADLEGEETRAPETLAPIKTPAIMEALELRRLHETGPTGFQRSGS